MSEITLKNFSPDVEKQAQAWIDLPDRNMLIMGPVGTGKSTLVNIMFCELSKKVFGGDMCWAVMPIILRQSAKFEPVPQHIIDCGFLAMDDLGGGRLSDTPYDDWQVEKLYQITETRRRKNAVTVATTNLDAAGLERLVGEHVYSRLAGGAVGMLLSGHDRRRVALS